MLRDELPRAWQDLLAAEFDQPDFRKLEAFVAAERHEHTVFPPAGEVFNALRLTPPEQVRVLLLGQDPYHDDGQAHGLCFSVRPGQPLPPSLRNIFKERQTDLGIPPATCGFLETWATQGVLMLNAVLTVRAHAANSHQGHGWETFTDAVIRAVNRFPERVVFVLWGNYARKKVALIGGPQHVVITSAHPSPLSARHGFFGSQPFSRINAALREAGRGEIDWRLPDYGPVQGELF